MIIFEFLWKTAATLLYGIMRPVIWLLTGRGCAQCKHSKKGSWGNIWCGLHKEHKCLPNPWRPLFERKERKRRKFFDILY